MIITEQDIRDDGASQDVPEELTETFVELWRDGVIRVTGRNEMNHLTFRWVPPS